MCAVCTRANLISDSFPQRLMLRIHTMAQTNPPFFALLDYLLNNRLRCKIGPQRFLGNRSRQTRPFCVPTKNPQQKRTRSIASTTVDWWLQTRQRKLADAFSLIEEGKVAAATVARLDTLANTVLHRTHGVIVARVLTATAALKHCQETIVATDHVMTQF